ncbi:MAG: potassium channel family protein [Silvibacterium sp.]
MSGILPQKNEHVVPRTGWPLKMVQQRFLLLFIFLLASLLLYPYAENTAFGYFAFRIAGSAAILLSVYAASYRRSLVVWGWGLLLAIPALVHYLRILRLDASLFSLININLSFAFDLFIVIVMFRRVFANEKPDAETVFGALCIYMFVGLSFTSVYELVYRLQPHAFYLDPAMNTHTVLNRFDFIYYSFGTMTALGASGITAVSNQARSLTIIEAMLGIFYLAVVIARLVSSYRIHFPPRAD